MKVNIYTHDPILTLCRTEEESNELFGSDFFEDYSVEVPDELANEIMATYDKLRDLSAQLNDIYKQYLKSKGY